MANELSPQERARVVDGILADLGQVANEVAGQHVFEDFRKRNAANTLRRHNADLVLFAANLAEVGADVSDLASDPAASGGDGRPAACAVALHTVPT
jgi:hypothetical protein